MNSRARRIAVILAAVLVSLLGLPSPASAQTPGKSTPFPGNPHHYRLSGQEAVVRFAVAPSAKALHPLLQDAATSWNNNSPYMIVQTLPLGADCSGWTESCVIVAENNNTNCNHADTFLNTIPGSLPGHNHFLNALIAGNFQDCGLSLLQLKYLMCHEYGHALGVNHDSTGIRPCSPGDGLPVGNDYNVRNILGATPQ